MSAIPTSSPSLETVASIAHIVSTNLTSNNSNLQNPWEQATKIISQTTGTSTPVTTAVVPNIVVLNNQTQKSIKELFYNGTGYYIEDEVEPVFGVLGLNDLQTLFLACFATLIPLVISLLTAFGIRVLWTKYKRQKDVTEYDGILERRTTSESISRPLHSHLLNSDKKCETHLSINTEEVDLCDGISQIRTNNHSNTNGSIITMTLKNNHLIVETEERNDIEEDSRETTMKYSPSARDGVFVVEVQQGVRRSPGHTDPEVSGAISDQCALVHNPPDRFNEDETLEETDNNYVETSSPPREALLARTGLAQSTQSLTRDRPSYCYSNQQSYDTGTHGYPIYAGYVPERPPPPPGQQQANNVEDCDKPKITAAVYKNRSRTVDGDDAYISIPEAEIGGEGQKDVELAS